MKLIRQKLSRYLCGCDWLWAIIPDSMRKSQYFMIQRRAALEAKFCGVSELVFASNYVMAGPFAGLRYPTQQATGSALFPKLVGSYESELHPVIDHLLGKAYPLVIDIGFAEGYYLVGIGMKIREARLLGYDINEEAHSLCRKLAEANGVASGRMTLMSACSTEALSKLLPQRSLVICDCEGFESELFTEETTILWTQSDLLIECHDFEVPGITGMIASLLKGSHEIRIVESVATESKVHWVDNSRFDKFRSEHKLRLVEEGRPCVMNWIVAEVKDAAASASEGPSA